MTKATVNCRLDADTSKAAIGSSRRGALKFSVAAFAAGLAGSALASQPAGSVLAENDPFLIRHKHYLTLCRDYDFDPRHELQARMRADLIAYYGPEIGTDYADTCGYACDVEKFQAVGHELDNLYAARVDDLMELMAIQPTTLAGFRVKARLLADSFFADFDTMDVWEQIPYLVLNDALHFLGEKQLSAQPRSTAGGFPHV